MVIDDDNLYVEKKWTPDSTTKFGFVVNIKSVQESEFFTLWVSLFFDENQRWYKSIVHTSKLVLSLVYHDHDFAWKSSIATIIAEFV